MNHHCEDGTVVVTAPDRGHGLYQVHSRPVAGDCCMYRAPGPFTLEKRFPALCGAKAFIAESKAQFVEYVIVTDPEEVEKMMRSYSEHLNRVIDEANATRI